MQWFKVILILTIFSLISAAEKARYDFYRLYSVSIDYDVQLKVMQAMAEYPDGYQFLNSPPSIINIKTQLIVPPHKFGEWSELIEKFNFDVKLLNNNLQDSIDKEEARYRRRKAFAYDLDEFWTLEEIEAWMQEKASARPNDVSIFSIGTSYEGNDIQGLRINVGGGSKPAIFVEATIHAGEWLGATSTIYIINELLTNNNYTYLSDFDWYFLPVLNVDGYKYTWTSDRLWRKTRRPNKSLLCTGADPNRNSDINWNVSSVSTNPCSHNYPGDFAFSEPEIRQLSEFMSNSIANLAIYFSFHTFGQFFMIPTGFTDQRIENYTLHYEIGEVANQAILNATGAVYELGPVPQFFGLVSGISFDWVVEYIKPVLTYCWELRPTWDEFEYEGDIISPKLIGPTARDMYAAVTTVINEAKSRGVL